MTNLANVTKKAIKSLKALDKKLGIVQQQLMSEEEGAKPPEGADISQLIDECKSKWELIKAKMKQVKGVKDLLETE